jgi:mono/diheme cytochrome c family protein
VNGTESAMAWRRFSRWVGAALVLGLAGVAVFAWGRVSADTAADIAAGRALFNHQCAVCHGEGGRGDGPSAANFATKPADLTDGRLMNPLPDEFLRNVIRHGGAAEGLSPGMPPFAAHLNENQLRQVVAFVRSLAQPPHKPEESLPVVTIPGAPTQPILFSHLVHAGSYQIPCQYCHAEARRSVSAGMPSVERCMGCHKIVGAQDNPEIAKLHEHWNRQQPIRWRRVFKVPEFTYFPHKAHIRANITCQTCHGPIERMRVVGARIGPTLANDLVNLVRLRPRNEPMTMGWCIDCHREQNAKHQMKAPLDCVACHH